MTPRYYQRESVDAIFAEWGNYRGALLHMTMSLGKTVVMGMTAERILAGGGRVLLFCHLGELLDDGAGGGAFHVFKRIMPTARIFFEQNVEKVSRYDIENESPDVVMGTVQSLRRRLEKYPPDFFSHIFIDEGHRGAAQTYLEVIHAFPDAKVLYVTATPQKLSKLTKVRGDETKRSLKGYIFEDIDGEKKQVSLCGEKPAYQMDFGRAVEEGWVVEPIPVEAKVDIDWSTLRMSGGDYSESHLDEIMKEDAPLHEVANAIVANGKTTKRIVFMPGCDSARGLAHLLRTSYGVLADCVDGKTDKVLRKEIIAAFKGDGVDCLVNVLVGTEGFDCPGIEEVVIGRPTRSEGLYQQIMGRGQRLNPGDLVDQFPAAEDAPMRLAAIAASPKPRFRLVDLVGNLGNLPKPISGKDVLIGELPHKEYGNQPRPEDKDVRAVAARNPDLTVDELRQRASDELYMQEVLMGVRWRHSVQADVRLHEYKDFFSIPFTIPEPKKAKVHKKPPPGKEATPKQLGLLKNLYDSWYDKRPNPEWIASLTKRQAGKIIDDLQRKLKPVREVVDAT